jgi:hypothetical protein
MMRAHSEPVANRESSRPRDGSWLSRASREGSAALDDGRDTQRRRGAAPDQQPSQHFLSNLLRALAVWTT